MANASVLVITDSPWWQRRSKRRASGLLRKGAIGGAIHEPVRPHIAPGLKHHQRSICHASDAHTVAKRLKSDTLDAEWTERRSRNSVDNLTVVDPMCQGAIFHHVLRKEMKRFPPTHSRDHERRSTPRARIIEVQTAQCFGRLRFVEIERPTHLSFPSTIADTERCCGIAFTVERAVETG